ncbi:MAG: hypothetical protein M1830_006952 [Pleopsidium flavum]|nr:MAG: hypothetical protein M1830_006952 [Pleopsidium flavum]
MITQGRIAKKGILSKNNKTCGPPKEGLPYSIEEKSSMACCRLLRKGMLYSGHAWTYCQEAGTVKNGTARGPPKERLPYLADNTDLMAHKRQMYTMRGLELQTQKYESAPRMDEKREDSKIHEEKKKQIKLSAATLLDSSMASVTMQAAGTWAALEHFKAEDVPDRVG